MPSALVRSCDSLSRCSLSPCSLSAHRRTICHYPWAVPIAPIYEAFPLVCPLCGGPMRLIAFITQGAQVSKILDRIGPGDRFKPATQMRCVAVLRVACAVHPK